MAGSEFVFVDQSDGGKVSNNKETRRQVRKQAMRDAGLARKQRGGYGQHNLRQYPNFAGDEEPSAPTQPMHQEDQADVDGPIWREWETAYQLAKVVPKKLPPGTYDRLRSSIDFDVTVLAPVTALSFGRGAARALAKEPTKLVNLLLSCNTTYLNFLPGRYHGNPLLSDVLYCTAAQSRWLLRPGPINAETAILAAYGNALQRLQTALTDPEQCLDADVLCATQLLALFEVRLSRTEYTHCWEAK